ncbi:phosphatidate cytidylyltransferase [Oceanivirga salmonicida]|uniref:phosphatidate cytidylyltransferase n=1 Tax=Oceanivirga salmonicida TaxID=1769291 RepID=UPI00083614D0|nr:phosphatidate cytidylyltransferase [Oceanivirga salmonicida]
MLSRLFVAIFGIIALLGIFLGGNVLLLLFTEIIVIASCLELIMMSRNNRNTFNVLTCLFISALIPVLTYFDIDSNFALFLLIIMIGLFQIVKVNLKDASSKLSSKLFISVYVSVLFSYILKLERLEEGTALIVFSFLLVWFCDSFAYMVGMKFGKHKFTPISPKKSIEGLIGGFVGVLFISRFFGYVYYIITLLFSYTGLFNVYPKYVEFFNGFNIKLILFSIVITAFAVLGDLFESKIKREFNVKDSSRLLLEHGGVLDRFDSSLFVIPLMYMIFTYLLK